MDISAEIVAIQAASQGSELRQPLVGALNKLNSGSLPAVTASDAGKILKVGANGWEVGEKSGYMPVPTATKQITENGTHDVTNYASAIVNVAGGGGSVEYTLVEYIQDDGTQAISTGLSISASTTFEYDAMFIEQSPQAWALPCGAIPNNLKGIYLQYDGTNLELNASGAYETTYSSVKNVRNTAFSSSSIGGFTVFGSNSNAKISSSEGVIFHAFKAIRANGNFGPSMQHRLYRIRIDSHVFLPVKRNSDGTYGLLDIYDNSFHGDVLNGNAFTAGNEINY